MSRFGFIFAADSTAHACLWEKIERKCLKNASLKCENEANYLALSVTRLSFKQVVRVKKMFLSGFGGALSISSNNSIFWFGSFNWKHFFLMPIKLSSFWLKFGYCNDSLSSSLIFANRWVTLPNDTFLSFKLRVVIFPRFKSHITRA